MVARGWTLEAVCGKCGETFVPHDEDDLIHGETEDGKPCMGQGRITGAWTGSKNRAVILAGPQFRK